MSYGLYKKIVSAFAPAAELSETLADLWGVIPNRLRDAYALVSADEPGPASGSISGATSSRNVRPEIQFLGSF